MVDQLAFFTITFIRKILFFVFLLLLVKQVLLSCMLNVSCVKYKYDDDIAIS